MPPSMDAVAPFGKKPPSEGTWGGVSKIIEEELFWSKKRGVFVGPGVYKLNVCVGWGPASNSEAGGCL